MTVLCSTLQKLVAEPILCYQGCVQLRIQFCVPQGLAFVFN